MIRLIHRDTGDFFYVHESRLDEYLENGHRLPPPPKMPPPPPPRESDNAAEPRKAARKTAARTKK